MNWKINDQDQSITGQDGMCISGNSEPPSQLWDLFFLFPNEISITHCPTTVQSLYFYFHPYERQTLYIIISSILHSIKGHSYYLPNPQNKQGLSPGPIHKKARRRKPEGPGY